MPEIRNISLALIDEPELALRADMDDTALEELASDIRQNGLYYPLIVHAKADRFEVRDGHRRLLACRRLQLVDVRCIIHGELDPPPEAVKLKTNLLREDNTDAEIATWLGELAQKHSYSLDQLCKMVGRSGSWVNDRIDLLRGDPDVLQALGERKIKFAHARVLNRCKSDALRAEGLRFAIFDHIPSRKLEEWIQRNDGAPAGNSGTPEGATIQPQNGTVVSGGIACFFCGGDRDPQNMENIWVHRWELDVVRKVLSGGSQDV